MSEAERFEVHVFVADATEGHDDYRYTAEHWFSDRPDIETIAALFDEAKKHFAVLYPEGEAGNFCVNVSRLRPRDNWPPGLIGQPQND